MVVDFLKMPYVQKVLPLVYDESLSYYEVLCKMKDKLNETIGQVDKNAEDIAELKAEMAVVQEWIDDFDIHGFARLTGADFTGAITTTSSVTAAEGFVGDLTGDVTGDVTGNVTGDVTGNVTGNVRGNVVGNVQGDLTGNVTGNLTGNVSGSVTGNVHGNVQGNVSGTLTGDSHGTHYGGVVGNVTGNLTGLADEAKILDVPRTLVTDLASDSSDPFDGSDDADLGVKGVLPVTHGGTGNNSVDSVPTAGSTKMVTSDGIKNALDAIEVEIAGKQDELTFDIAPAQGSQNPVTSDGIYNAISQAGVGVVSSVFGRVGVIVAGDGDYNAGQVTYDNTGSHLTANRVQSAIDEVVQIIENKPNDLVHLTDVVISAPTDGQVLKYDASTQKWKNGTDVSGIAPDNVSNLSLVAGNGKVTIVWSDPDDTVISGQTICTWSKTKLVMKVGGYPANEDDGTVILTNSVRDQYAVNGYEVTGLTNGTTYYFQLFPVSTGGAVNRDSANRVSGTPQPNVQISVTITGAKEDTVVITDSNNQTVGTCVFDSGAVSGVFTTVVETGYSDTWTFTSSVSNYVAAATIDGTPSQAVKCMPEDVAYWYGNEVEAFEVGTFTDSSGNSAIVTPTVTRNTNNILIELPNPGNKDQILGGIKTTNTIDYTGKTSLKVRARLEYLIGTPAGYYRFSLFGSVDGATEISSIQPSHMQLLVQAIQSEYNVPGTASGEFTVSLTGVQNNHINLASQCARIGMQYNKLWIDAVYTV